MDRDTETQNTGGWEETQDRTGLDPRVKTRSRRRDDASERWTAAAASAPNLTVPQTPNQMTERNPTPSRLLTVLTARRPLRHERVHLQMKGHPASVKVTGFPPAAKTSFDNQIVLYLKQKS